MGRYFSSPPAYTFLIDTCNRDLGLVAVLSVYVGLLSAVALSSTPTLPSGADAGNLLAESYVFGDPAIEATYAPILPLIMGQARRLAPELADLAGLIKGLGVVLLFFQAGCLGSLAWAARGSRAATLTFMLALSAPAAWTQLGWGGYGQFLGTGFGALALAGLTLGARATSERGRLLASAGAGAALGLVALSHIYSVPFFGAACLAVIARVRFRRARELAAFALAAVAVVLPGLETLVRVAGLGSELRASGGGVMDALIPVLEAIQNIGFHPLASALSALPLAVALSFKASRAEALVRTQWEPWIAGAATLSLLTPMLQFDRIWLLAAHAATLSAAYGLASLSSRNAVLGGVALWALIATPAALTQNERLFQNSGRLTIDEARLLTRLPAGPVLAVATDTPNVAGYWYRGLTGRRAIIGDRYRWYASEKERRNSALVQNLLLGDYGLLGSPLSLIAKTAEPTEATLVFDDGVERCALFRIEVAQGAARISGVQSTLVIESEAATELVLEPVQGSTLSSINESSEGIELTWEYRYAPYRPRGLLRRILVKGAVLVTRDKGAGLRMSGRGTIEGLSPSRKPIGAEWTLAALRREGAGWILVSRAQAPHLQSTFALAPIDSAGRLTVFDIGSTRADTAPDSIVLRARPQYKAGMPAR